MKLLRGIIFGAVLGIAGTFVHNAWPPFGLIVAVAGTFSGIRYLGQIHFERTVKVVASASWTFVVWRASTIGNGDELLITSGTTGSYFVFCGFISALMASLLAP